MAGLTTCSQELNISHRTSIISNQIWFKKEEQLFQIQTDKFSEGAFREAYKAYTFKNGKSKLCVIFVIKKFKKESWEKMMEIHGMTLEQHTRKQTQMHIAAQAIANRLVKKCKDFTAKQQFFAYNSVYFSMLGDEPITVESFVEGNFVKYINNDENPGVPVQGKKTLYEKAEALTHFYHEESEGRLLLVDLQGSDYNLYDPEIATSSELDGSDNERFFK